MYNEMALMGLQGRSPIFQLNNISLPFPCNDSDQEKSPLVPYSDDKEELPAALEHDYEMVKSPTAKVPSAVPDRESPMS